MAGASRQTSEPWYADGLRFRCTQCGDCCTGAEGYVWVNQQEVEELAAARGMTPAVFERRFVKRVGIRRSLKERKGGDCVLLDADTRKCTVYDARPRQCRTWPFWDSNLRSPEAWAEAAEACPGCNKGNLVPLEQIVEQAAKIRL
ncbi:MAG: YkgJ family cysteine cluster protein [Pirellulales bacterium]|jgi:Fe-S-cluster containining protein|nr:YkgJ family cysteine cluster protein [Pirellulales bacterium]